MVNLNQDVVRNLQWIYEILFWIGKDHEVLEIQTMFLNYLLYVWWCFYLLNRMGSVKSGSITPIPRIGKQVYLFLSLKYEE